MSISDHFVTMGGSQATADNRANIELKVLKPTNRTEAVQLCWIDARVMLVDCTTRELHRGRRTFLDHVMTRGVWALSSEAVLLESHRHERGQNVQRSAQEVLETLAGQVGGLADDCVGGITRSTTRACGTVA